eukprot:gene11388-11536_t
MARGLVIPSTPISNAAVLRLQQQASACGQAVSKSGDDSISAAPGSFALSRAGFAETANGRLMLKSLPTELLYDTVGLQLFDHITHIPEYYLTAAEADILAAHGLDIVKSCGISDGSMLLELGAGSMRKTRLLLEAVVAAGHQGVSFCALDLCPRSLAGALQSLQGVFKGRIGLVGLVGAYEQGLEYIQQQQNGADMSNRNPNSLLLHDLSMADIRITEEDDLDNQADDLCCSGECTEAPSHHAIAPAAAAGRDTHRLAPAGPGIDDNSNQWCNDDADKAAPAADPAGLSGPGQHKVILWLGSSLGNFTREGGAAFLKRIKELALQPGDKLLVGIDRRNQAAQVQLAYCDPQRVTRAFILNGLQHAKRILDEQILPEGVAEPSSMLSAAAMTHSSCVSDGCNGRFSIVPEHFEYFSVYNEELGRHEAYYQALQETVINIPASAVACAEANGAPDATQAKEATHLDDDHNGNGSCGPQGATGVVPVVIAAGELLHVEYSHKYSHEEVLALADAGGLQWVQAWTDSRQQYNLHMFSLPCN